MFEPSIGFTGPWWIYEDTSLLVLSGSSSGTATRPPWPARWPVYGRPTLSRYPIGTGEEFSAGDLITISGGDATDITGSDPTNLFGIAQEGSSGCIEEGFVMICELDANHWYGMMGTRDPVSGDIGTAYGIIQNSDGHWLVDLDDTANTRVTVKAIDEEQEYFYVVFDSNHIQ